MVVASVVRHALRRLQPLARARRPGLTVLAYHLVGAGSDSPVDLPPERFRRQMEELAEGGRVVDLDEAARALERGDLPGDAVALTFDDAYRNFYDKALPILRELALPATLFVPIQFVDGAGPGPIEAARDLPACTWEQLGELAAGSEVRIGSHGWTHRDLRRLGPDELARELADSRRTLEERAGARVGGFCYPRALWNRRLERHVAAAYAWAVIGGGRKNRPRAQPLHRLHRVPIRRDGPASLAPVLEAEVWLEEWCLSRARLVAR